MLTFNVVLGNQRPPIPRLFSIRPTDPISGNAFEAKRKKKEMASCNFRPILPRLQKGFCTIFIAFFRPLPLCFCYYSFDFLSRFFLETKESSIKLHDNRKGLLVDHIVCEFPVYPRSKLGQSKDNVVFPTHRRGSKLTLSILLTVFCLI